jgi:hypothetical protein
MNWVHFFYFAGHLLQIIANVIILYKIFPLYKRTKQLSFLLLFYAYLIGTFDTICDLTIGQNKMVGSTYIAYYSMRRLAYISDIVLFLIGFLLLLDSYIRYYESASTKPPENGDSPVGNQLGFLSRIFRKMGE